MNAAYYAHLPRQKNWYWTVWQRNRKDDGKILLKERFYILSIPQEVIFGRKIIHIMLFLYGNKSMMHSWDKFKLLRKTLYLCTLWNIFYQNISIETHWTLQIDSYHWSLLYNISFSVKERKIWKLSESTCTDLKQKWADFNKQKLVVRRVQRLSRLLWFKSERKYRR